MKKGFRNHVVIIGWDDFSRTITEQLVNAGKQICIVTDIKKNAVDIKNSFNTGNIQAVATDTEKVDELRKAHIQSSAAVLVNIGKDTEKLVYVLSLRKHFPSAKLVVPIHNPNLKDTFNNAGVTYPLSKDEIAAKMLASYLFEEDVALYSSDLVSTARCDEDYDIQQYRITKSNPYNGTEYGRAFRDMKKRYNAVLIGLSKYSGADRGLLKNPHESTVIHEKDYLIVIVNGKTSDRIKKDFKVSEGYSG